MTCAWLVSSTPVLVQSPSPLIQNLTSSTSMHSATTCSGCMFCRLFASLYFPRTFGVPIVECIHMLLYWPHPRALVARNSGTNVGYGPIKSLFLSLILFPLPAH